ncbi:MAG: histidine kinase [Bacteroidales bacterium]|nr:histidine kinase [Bacteroidales bacterium]
MINLDYCSKSLNWRRLMWHSIFWTAYIVFLASIYGSLDKDYGQRFQEVFIMLPTRMVAAYFTIYVLVMRLLLVRKYLFFAISLLLSVLFFSLVQRVAYYYITYPLFYPKFLENDFFHWPIIFKGIINLYTVTIGLLSLKFLKFWYESQSIKQQLENEKTQAELKLLKAQIHPHFLFNTLNNLYALTLKKSDLAPQIVLKLSHLLNYMLYECNVQYASLSKEVEMLNNYIELEKIRYGDRINFEFDIDGDTNGVQIAPLLFLPFVENSFKHGTSGNIDNSWINIILKIDESEIIFQIENSKELEAGEESFKEGIGLKNVKRRLELLHKGDYELTIEDKGDSYFVLMCLKNNQY